MFSSFLSCPSLFFPIFLSGFGLGDLGFLFSFPSSFFPRSTASTSSVMLLYLAGQCAFFSARYSPLDRWNLEGFPEVPRTDSFCSSRIGESGPESSGWPQQASQRGSVVLEARDPYSLALVPQFHRPGQKLFCFWVWLVVGAIERSCYSPTM